MHSTPYNSAFTRHHTGVYQNNEQLARATNNSTYKFSHDTVEKVSRIESCRINRFLISTHGMCLSPPLLIYWNRAFKHFSTTGNMMTHARRSMSEKNITNIEKGFRVGRTTWNKVYVDVLQWNLTNMTLSGDKKNVNKYGRGSAMLAYFCIQTVCSTVVFWGKEAFSF